MKSKKHRCTPRHWFKLMCEAGMDKLEIKKVMSDKKEPSFFPWNDVRCRRRTVWKEKKSRDHKEPSLIRRNECKQCERTFKSRAGLATHTRELHRENKKEHRCKRCPAKFTQKSNLKNHGNERCSTTSQTKYVPANRECPTCRKLIPATKLERHTRCYRGRRAGIPTV